MTMPASIGVTMDFQEILLSCAVSLPGTAFCQWWFFISLSSLDDCGNLYGSNWACINIKNIYGTLKPLWMTHIIQQVALFCTVFQIKLVPSTSPWCGGLRSCQEIMDRRPTSVRRPGTDHAFMDLGKNQPWVFNSVQWCNAMIVSSYACICRHSMIHLCLSPRGLFYCILFRKCT